MSRWLGLTTQEQRDLREQLRAPLFAFAVLIIGLAINVAMGWFQPFPHVWILNFAVLIVMIATVLLFSMEVIKEPGLIRIFSALGFCWVMILFTMTLIDYLSR